MKLITAVGALCFCAKTQRCLYLLRSKKQIGTWGLVGGRKEFNESTKETLFREFIEEIGSVPTPNKLIPIETYTSEDDNFKFITYICVVPHEFIPILNQEHHGYCWVKLGEFPKPLHPGLWNTLNFGVIKQKINTITAIDSWDFQIQ
jgi:8-oxo-dGTP pyrophosphatase MutT (NUDIX family)